MCCFLTGLLSLVRPEFLAPTCFFVSSAWSTKGEWDFLFVSRPEKTELVVGLNVLVGFIGLWSAMLVWARDSNTLLPFFPGFLLRATRTQGPNWLSLGPAYFIDLLVYACFSVPVSSWFCTDRWTL